MFGPSQPFTPEIARRRRPSTGSSEPSSDHRPPHTQRDQSQQHRDKAQDVADGHQLAQDQAEPFEITQARDGFPLLAPHGRPPLRKRPETAKLLAQVAKSSTRPQTLTATQAYATSGAPGQSATPKAVRIPS